MDASFRAGGLASGMDTNAIIDQLVALESRPLDQLRRRQAAFRTQISALGDIAASLSGLSAAAADLGDHGVLATQARSTSTAFSAAPGADAIAGSYRLAVKALAQPAKWRSAAFAAGAGVAGGTLRLTVQGTAVAPIAVPDGASLADVAYAIRQSGAAVSAVVLDDGTSSWLSVTARDTGHPLDGAPADALSISFTPSAGAVGQAPGFAELQPARNAQVEVDGLTFTRTGNVIADALPGVTLTLAAAGGPAEDLVLGTDPAGTQARLQKLVDGYNGVMRLLQRHLAVAKDSDRATTLAGDSTLRTLQARLQRVLVTEVPGLSSGVRTLADLGVRTGRDGSLSVDAATLSSALARDPAAANALFSTSGTGLAAVVKALVADHTRAGDGALVLRQDGLGRTVKDLDGQAAALQLRIDAFQQNLIRQFTAMESTVSGLKSIGSFLAGQTTQQQKGS
ncbi:flagellar filament capping protein FliD [Anaeromyxobacter dehalogenans]|uniref:Flagellar hook-associated protein 2 n=1 Tax=Anaeromyxobacter dehalogenans (strain 2CP-C) TaxID=290397 RepID=Q2IQN2_ANADE|nr:flagellar filament capping protein FliD [Anaeromyxobacter dehalogenans]ABC81115.1 flagellar hook-associated protein 2-like protein [Anaeromyxobacter dehalogenans 2CP-C]